MSEELHHSKGFELVGWSIPFMTTSLSGVVKGELLFHEQPR